MGYTAVARVRTPAERALELVQLEHPNYHPLTALARMAHDARVKEDPRVEMEVHKAILPYVAPRLAVQEVKAIPDDDRRIVVSLFEDVALPDGTTASVEVPLIREVTEIVPLD